MQHHIHISTEFLFFTGLLFLGFVGIILAFIVSIRRDKADRAEAQKARDAATEWAIKTPVPPNYAAATPSWHPTSTQLGPQSQTSYYAPQAAPVYVHTGSPGTDLFTGVLLGEALASHHNNTTVVHETYVDTPTHHVTYSDPSPAPSAGFTYDSGSDSSSSTPSDSGGGFDVSWSD